MRSRAEQSRAEGLNERPGNVASLVAGVGCRGAGIVWRSVASRSGVARCGVWASDPATSLCSLPGFAGAESVSGTWRSGMGLAERSERERSDEARPRRAGPLLGDFSAVRKNPQTTTNGRFGEPRAGKRRSSNPPRRVRRDPPSLRQKTNAKKPPEGGFFHICVPGGERGIRTPDRLLTYTRFPGVRLQPLIHLSWCPSVLLLPRCERRRL